MELRTDYQLEHKLMEEAYEELKSTGKLSNRLKEELEKTFGERFSNGWQLANSKKVRMFQFAPSGRVVWVVEGRKSEYQVLPEIPFCYCDDYYFRVMDKKRGLCYHIIALHVAEALGNFQKISKKDSQYSTITARWRAKEPTESLE